MGATGRDRGKLIGEFIMTIGELKEYIFERNFSDEDEVMISYEGVFATNLKIEECLYGDKRYLSIDETSQ